jgi:GNAT superfamily N-acetyltransferase
MTINLNEITLRSSTPNDIDIVLENHISLYSKEFNYPPTQFGTHVSKGLLPFRQPSPPGHLWIAEYTTPPSPTSNPNTQSLEWAGCVAVVPTDDDSTGRLRFMLVAPKFRSCGLGRKLLETALEYCVDMGYARVTLSTTGDCVGAHRLYTLFGFRQVEVTPGILWGESTHEWWEKQLDKD